MIGCDRWRLAYLVRAGLLSPRVITSKMRGNRPAYRWSENDVRQARSVLYLLRVGFTHDQIRHVASEGRLEHVAEATRDGLEQSGEQDVLSVRRKARQRESQRYRQRVRAKEQP